MSGGYFSRLTLLPAARGQRWYHDALERGELYCDHAAVWRAFPGDDVQRDFLYRVGESRADGRRLYYVASRRRPTPIPGELLVESKGYEPHFSVGDVLGFSLRANPTVSKGPKGTRGKRHDVLMNAKSLAKSLATPGKSEEEAVDEAAVKWLVDRSPAIGLDIDVQQLRRDGYRQHIAGRARGQPLRFSSLDFDGCATVTDPGRLTAALFSGVGHSKGFGCGLLLVRRL